MRLLAAAVTLFHARRTPIALIGAAAMAAHGVSRATRDLDVLVADLECLSAEYWQPLLASGVRPRVRRGDADDPLAGVVRLESAAELPLDVIVGRHPWQADIIARAVEVALEGVTMPVATRPDLILLKLYAGGPQDAWDIQQLLGGPDSAAAVADVESRLSALPPECRALWTSILGRPGGPPPPATPSA